MFGQFGEKYQFLVARDQGDAWEWVFQGHQLWAFEVVRADLVKMGCQFWSKRGCGKRGSRRKAAVSVTPRSPLPTCTGSSFLSLA